MKLSVSRDLQKMPQAFDGLLLFIINLIMSIPSGMKLNAREAMKWMESESEDFVEMIPFAVDPDSRRLCGNILSRPK